MPATKRPGLFVGLLPLTGPALPGTTHYGRIAAGGWAPHLKDRAIAIVGFPWGRIDDRFLGDDPDEILAKDLAENPFCPLWPLLFDDELWAWAQREGNSLVILLPETEPEWCYKGPAEWSPAKRMTFLLLQGSLAIEPESHLVPAEVAGANPSFAARWEAHPDLFGSTALALPGSRPRHARHAIATMESIRKRTGALPPREPLGDGWPAGRDALRKQYPEAAKSILGLKDRELVLRSSENPDEGLAMRARIGAGSLFVLFSKNPSTSGEVGAMVSSIEAMAGVGSLAASHDRPPPSTASPEQAPGGAMKLGEIAAILTAAEHLNRRKWTASRSIGPAARAAPPW